MSSEMERSVVSVALVIDVGTGRPLTNEHLEENIGVITHPEMYI